MKTDAIRQPAVAGAFYPADPAALRSMIEALLEQADTPDAPAPCAAVIPHAGYVYSGPVAATAYKLIQKYAARYRHVILLGPSHRVPFHGVAATSDIAYRTPLGDLSVDSKLYERLGSHDALQCLPKAHAPEHSLEVQAPFIQMVLPEASFAPLVIGYDTPPRAVADILRPVADDPETLLIASSDLSHFLSYERAQQTDEYTSGQILELNPDGLDEHSACGRVGIGALLILAAEMNWKPHLLDLRNSGDTAGPRNEVVGYGAYAFVPGGGGS